jgi:hypothetical protein
VTNDEPLIFHYKNRPPRLPRWPWIVIGLIAVASCIAYGCYFAGLLSFDSLVGTIELVTFGVIGVAAIIAGIKYGTQNKDYWA